MSDILKTTEEKMNDSINSMINRFNSVRAGRANAAILDGVLVVAYGSESPLNQLASISVPEARQLMIKPFDKSLLGDIERGIYEANIGLTPNNNGEVIFLNIPALTEETRKNYVKQIKSYGEDAKISLRNARQDANNDLKKLELPEDEEKQSIEIVQELINKFNKKVDEMIKEKEEELMTV